MEDPAAYARELETLAARLKRDVAQWLRTGGDARPVAAGARRQQLLYRTLRRDPELARRVLDEIDGDLRGVVDSHVRAAQKLRGLVTPVESPSELALAGPAPPRALRSFYAEAEAAHGVPWHVLAAVNFVESKFGRVLGPSAVGALGPMQFLPDAWATYGDGGNVMDPRDAIMAAARYLAALGANEDPRAALFAYNPSEAYVDAVLTYASEMAADETAFYVYYFWRVVVATTTGDVVVA